MTVQMNDRKALRPQPFVEQLTGGQDGNRDTPVPPAPYKSKVMLSPKQPETQGVKYDVRSATGIAMSR